MNKWSFGLVTTAVLALSGTCDAQLTGVTPEMIASSLPEEGAPLAEPGALPRCHRAGLRGSGAEDLSTRQP